MSVINLPHALNPVQPAQDARTYLVTGGAGFIGSHLVDRLLADGHHVRVLDDLSTGRRINRDPRCTFILGDVCDPATVRNAMEGVAGCFHLAAIASVARSNEDWIGTHRCNQAGTVSVLDAARLHGRVPVVYASSAAIYGDAGSEPVCEERMPGPMTAYGVDKLGSEMQARIAFHVHKVPTMGFRFFNVYGPRQDPNSPYSGVISIFAKRVAAGLPLTIHGDGGQARDFVFVLDVVEHLAAGMKHLDAQGGAKVQNVCTGRPVTILQLATLLMELCGREVALTNMPARTGDIRHSQGSYRNTEALLGVRATMPLERGLAVLLAHDDAEPAMLHPAVSGQLGQMQAICGTAG